MPKFVKFTKLNDDSLNVRPEWVSAYGTSKIGNYVVIHHVQIEVKQTIEQIEEALDAGVA